MHFHMHFHRLIPVWLGFHEIVVPVEVVYTRGINLDCQVVFQGLGLSLLNCVGINFSFRLPQFKEEAKSYVGANMKKVRLCL